VIRGFDIRTQPIWLVQQDAMHTAVLLWPFLSAGFLLLRCKRIPTPVTVFCHAALAGMCCIVIMFLYFRFHFAEPDPTWISLTFLCGFTLIFLANLKQIFFPYEFLRAYQPDLPLRLQQPPSVVQSWGAILLLVGAFVGFQGYYASKFLGQGPQYLLIIAGTIELTPLQRIQVMAGTGVVAGVSGILLLVWPKRQGIQQSEALSDRGGVR
jgi:hypothetical protein